MTSYQGAPGVNPERVFVTKTLIDKQRNPPGPVDEELPTTTIKLRSTIRRGRVRAPGGTTLGSYRVTGSYRELTSPGTFALRVTRVSIYAGSRGISWMVRHSRIGTVDIQTFDAPGQVNLLGDPMKPVYAFGPGTLIYGFLEGGGTQYFLSQFMEGVVS
mgnify:CR=1 FL=1